MEQASNIQICQRFWIWRFLSLPSRCKEKLSRYLTISRSLQRSLQRGRSNMSTTAIACYHLINWGGANCEVEWKKLDEVVSLIRTGLNPRVHFKLNTPDADCNYVTVRELYGKDIICDEKTDKINKEAVNRIQERSKLQINDILFSGTGTIGKTAIVKEKPENWNIKEGVYAMTPNHSLIDSEFLLYCLHSKSVMNEILLRSAGSTVRSIPMAELKQVEIPCPSLEKQRGIVVILNSFDSLSNGLTEGLPAEINARQQQYEYYRDKLLTFKRAN